MSTIILTSSSLRTFETDRDPVSTDYEVTIPGGTVVEVDAGCFWRNTSTTPARAWYCASVIPATSADWRWCAYRSAATTFTPTIIGATSAGAGTYTSQIGRYFTVGALTQVHINITWTAHTGTGNLLIGALPSQPNTAVVQIGIPELQSIALPVGVLSVYAKTRSDTSLDVVASLAALADTPVAISAAGTIQLSMTYYV